MNKEREKLEDIVRELKDLLEELGKKIDPSAIPDPVKIFSELPKEKTEVKERR